jgi:hypothetical protein
MPRAASVPRRSGEPRTPVAHRTSLDFGCLLSRILLGSSSSYYPEKRKSQARLAEVDVHDAEQLVRTVFPVSFGATGERMLMNALAAG